MKLPEKLSDCLNEIISQGNAQTRIGVNKMKRKEIKVGDRVRVYDITGVYNTVVIDICGDICTTQNHAQYHLKQIRKLKPKKKAREWWLKFNTSNYTITFNNETFYSAVQVVSVKPHNLDGWIHVKAVLK